MIQNKVWRLFNFKELYIERDSERKNENKDNKKKNKNKIKIKELLNIGIINKGNIQARNS